MDWGLMFTIHANATKEHGLGVSTQHRKDQDEDGLHDAW